MLLLPDQVCQIDQTIPCTIFAPYQSVVAFFHTFLYRLQTREREGLLINKTVYAGRS